MLVTPLGISTLVKLVQMDDIEPQQWGQLYGTYRSKRQATDALRLLADAHGLECTPHNWGNVPDMALHFHVELALPNSYWFEMPFPAEYADRPYYKDKFRIDADGYVVAPTAPGLGYPMVMDALDKMLIRIDR